MTKYMENLTKINFFHVYRKIATTCKTFLKIPATQMLKTTTAQTSTNPFE